MPLHWTEEDGSPHWQRDINWRRAGRLVDGLDWPDGSLEGPDCDLESRTVAWRAAVDGGLEDRMVACGGLEGPGRPGLRSERLVDGE